MRMNCNCECVCDFLPHNLALMSSSLEFDLSRFNFSLNFFSPGNGPISSISKGSSLIIELFYIVFASYSIKSSVNYFRPRGQGWSMRCAYSWSSE